MPLPDRLGSLGSVKGTEEQQQPSIPKKDDQPDSASTPLLQRTAIIQKDEKGYGLTVSGDNPVYVASVKTGGAAEKAGVQIGDRIIKVNGKLVTNSNHTEVVKMIRAGSYVALSLLGKPSNSHPPNRESIIEREPGTFREPSGSFRDSIVDKITGPQPVDAEKEKDLRQQKANTIRVMYETVHEEYDKLRKSCKANPSDSKLQSQLHDKEKTLKILEAQLHSHPSVTGYNRDSQPPSINVDTDSLTSDTHPAPPLTASVPHTVSDLGSESPYTSPSSSPTPLQNLDVDTVTGDSGIEEGSQNSIVMSMKPSAQIIGIDDDDFVSDDESTGDSKVFSDLRVLETKPAHMAIFLHYVLNQHNPAPLLFYQMTSFYVNAQGSCKDLKKWAYEIHSTFIVHMAPLKVHSFVDSIIQEVDTTLTLRSEKEEYLRSIFNKARAVAMDDVQKLLEDLRQKKEQGLIEGSNDLKDHMDKNEEMKIVEKYLLPDLEKCVHSEEDDKLAAQGWAIATFLRHVGLTKSSSHNNVLERVPSFVTKDKQMSKFKFSSRSKSKNTKGHQFVLTHLYKVEFCLLCDKVLWGVGFQGYQCQTCDQCVHRTCVDDLEEVCSKKKKRPATALYVFKPKQTSQATPILSNTEREPAGSPTQQNHPSVLPQPLKEAEDKEISAFKESGHSVGSMVNRFENHSPDRESPGRKTDIGRSESMKGRGDTRDRPAKRSNSDLAMDDKSLREFTSPGSSTSSLRSMESASTSMDTLSTEIQNDSDFDVEPELPYLKLVLGEEVVRKLKPKEKKRQEVINELFYTEKCHVRNLKILDKLFYRPMLKEQTIPQDFTKSLFPNLETMIHLHGSLNNSMKTRRIEKSVITNVGDILLQRLDGEAGENFRNGCAIFCRNQSQMLETLKIRVRKEAKMAQLLLDAENNPLCQRLALKDIIPKQFMRLTKYPLLIENLLKYTQTNTDEFTNLERSLKCSKHILEYVNQAVKDCENHQRLIDLHRKLDKKAMEGGPEFDELRMFDLSKHKLLHDGPLTWNLTNRKPIELHVALIESAIVLLQKQDDRLVLKLQSTQLVPGKAEIKKHSPLLWLNNILARNDATDKKAFFVVNTSKAGPQIYKLMAGTADEQRIWTKCITQASEAMKKNEILKKKPPVKEETPTETTTTEPGTENGDLHNMEPSLVHPEDVTYNDAVINTAVQVITPLEKLRQNDEHLAAVLEERHGLIAELLNVDPNDVAEKVQDVVVGDADESVPQELIAACHHQTFEIVSMMKESTPPCALPNIDSGEHVESVEDLSLPIPMERLRDMANRMNQILTNLLAQTRATASSTPMTQAAVNSRDEERDRLRRELKFAQEELNRLRRIQRNQMEAQKDKGEDGEMEEVKPDRPSSIVSETSTVSEFDGDENKEDSEQTDEHETEVTEDDMPGIPIEPDLINESETLNEVSPGTMDTLVDTDAALDLETSGIDEPTMYEEAEVEEVEEDLHEMEPPEEDQMDDYDIDTPIVRVVGPESDYDDDGDDDDDDDDIDGVDKNEDVHEEKESEDEHITDDANKDIIDGSGKDLSEMEENNLDHRTTIDELTEGEGQTEDVLDRLRVDADAAGDSDTSSSSKRESGEVFHDAIEGQEVGSTSDITEDPGGLETVSKARNSDVSDIYESLSENENNTVNVDTDNKNQTNNNTEADKDSHVMQIQTDIDQSDTEGNIGEIQTDNTVTSLNESSLCEEV